MVMEPVVLEESFLPMPIYHLKWNYFKLTHEKHGKRSFFVEEEKCLNLLLESK
jgi:hypothetical protein